MIRVLHTADWHIGQLFHEYDRTYEHRQFLEWLLDTLTKEQIDVLLISGDVFDLSNPSAASIKMFYSFLNQSVKENPDLQVVVTAGNHDSAARLESPKPLLESTNIHIVGLVDKDENGNSDFGKMTIPLKNKEGNTEAWCIAAPFLRIGDYPSIPESANPYSEGVAAFYKSAYEYAASLKAPGQAIIAMGHLHAQQAEVGDTDKMERLIMGGIESISAASFHDNIRYVALGHIHKAQCVGGKEHVRYSGSPLPMSFSETYYQHQVVVFDIIADRIENQKMKNPIVSDKTENKETVNVSNAKENTGNLNDLNVPIDLDRIENLRIIEIPVSVPLQRIPSVHSPLMEVLSSLEQLKAYDGDFKTAPYLEVRVLLDGPEPGLRHKIESALLGKNFRLAKIDVQYRSSKTGQNDNATVNPEQLNELKPMEVLEKVYQNRYDNPIPDELLALFHQVTQEVE